MGPGGAALTFASPKTGMSCSSILGCLSSIVARSLRKLLTLPCPTTRISCMAIWASQVATSGRNGVQYVWPRAEQEAWWRERKRCACRALRIPAASAG
eukprot:scaffold101554_cov62-Phaeocystis_antarctica.AAC.3